VNVAAQEAYYIWLLDRFGVEPTAPFVYFKYRNRFHMWAMTGRLVNGWAELEGNWRFHSIWPVDDHECVHALVSALYFVAPPLFTEGVAVAHQMAPAPGALEPRWGGTHIDTLATYYLRAGDIPPLTALLRNSDFFQFDTNMTHPVAGSFVKFLLKRHGYDPIKTLFGASSHSDAPATLRTNYERIFGEDLQHAWNTWLTTLDGS
jgi:hypothetical protein